MICDSKIKSIVIFLSIIGCMLGCSYLNKKFGLEDDNLIEETFETILEYNLGLPDGSIDLTPNS